MTNQLEIIRKHLQTHGTITSWEAITRYGITRLAEYIRQLREEGLNIESVWQHNESKRWVLYVLVREAVYQEVEQGQLIAF